MKVMLRRPWSAPGGAFYEPKSTGVEIADDLKEFLPSDAKILTDQEAEKVVDIGNWPSPSGKNPPAVKLPTPDQLKEGEVLGLAPRKEVPSVIPAREAPDDVLIADGPFAGQRMSRRLAEETGLNIVAKPGEQPAKDAKSKQVPPKQEPSSPPKSASPEDIPPKGFPPSPPERPFKPDKK